jgi:hypothetical protein
MGEYDEPLTRIIIVIDADEPAAVHLDIWAAMQAEAIVEELWSSGIVADVVRVEVGPRRIIS